RLQQMSKDEIAHRLREGFRRKADLVRLRSGVRINEDPELDALVARCGSSLKDYLRDDVAPRFYPSTQNREEITTFIKKECPDWFDRALGDGGLLCEHRIHLLGHTDIALGGHIDWHCDPVSGYQWPRKFWAEYDLVSAPRADAKLIHELNRHAHLPR